jgi:hypothetical protein
MISASIKIMARCELERDGPAQIQTLPANESRANRLTVRVAPLNPGGIGQAVPQLLSSSAGATLAPVMRGSLARFPQRGLSPQQFTRMSGARNIGRWPFRSEAKPHL